MDVLDSRERYVSSREFMLCYVMLRPHTGSWRKYHGSTDETKARADAPAGDAVPRLLKSGTATDRGCARFQTRSKKLEPSSSYGVIQLKQLASSRRAAPPTPSTPSTAPARSAALCHRLTRVLRSQATRLWPQQPPPSTSRARLTAHYAWSEILK